jgi:alkyl sulfatase BDS1-like metallo-beta-lactamase superfamily hydrolase
MTTSVEATDATAAQNRAVTMSLPFDDRQDFEDAHRGHIGSLSPAVVETTSGRVVWDMESFGFLDTACPDTANPSLWRQSQLNAIHGLFEVVPGVYQVRALDLSNMTIIEGKTGVVVIDPLISTETAAAALALYRKHRGDRPVTGMIYTHSHVDHFGGSRGVLSPDDVAAGVPILAPEGLVEEAVSENVFAGPAMARRALYMYGSLLEPGPAGQVSAGLGMTTSTGSISLLRPTVDLTTTGEEHVVDGVRMVFQLTPGTEAPAEMNFHFPDLGVLCVAENATHNLHNLLTLRGALVRDPHMWSSYLNETIELFGARTDVVFASHHWPRWGNDRVLDFLRKQRDLYGYLHDQTLRLLNQGYVGSEIAEMLDLPPSLASEWHCRGYYGSVSHNVKAIYQRYMGWFDGNPAHLWGHPPVEAAKRYVDYMGGADAVIARARSSFDEGDYRWVAEVLNHVVFAEPDNTEARELEAKAFEQLGYGAENASWRSFFLTGAKELRHEPKTGGGFRGPAVDMVSALSSEQFLDLMAIRIDGPRASSHQLLLNVEFTDRDERFAVTLSNGVLTYVPDKWHDDAAASLHLEALQLGALTAGLADLDQALTDGSVTIEGDEHSVRTLLGLLDQPTPTFNIVTP